MIEAGQVFCPYCAHVFEEAYYLSNTHKEGVYLHRKRGGYAVSVATDVLERNGVDTSSVPKVKFYGSSGQETSGLPREIQVIFDDNHKATRMYRHCPHCGNKVKEDLGSFPTFVIGMVGAVSSGKSVLLNSMSYPKNVLSVNNAHYPYKLEIEPDISRYRESSATQIAGRGMTKVVSVQDRDNQTLVQAVLLDVSGEFYNNRGAAQKSVDPDEIWDLLCGNGEYPGVDACFFVQPIPGTGETKDFDNEKIAHDIARRVKEHAVFTNKPLAYIYTHLDEAIAKGVLPYKEDSVAGKIPLMTEFTFFKNSYSPIDMIDRIWVEHCIASSYGAGLLLKPKGKDTCGFLVQSCSTTKDTNGKKNENYDHRRNVMDPLLWVLNKLRLFPLTTEV